MKVGTSLELFEQKLNFHHLASMSSTPYGALDLRSRWSGHPVPLCSDTYCFLL